MTAVAGHGRGLGAIGLLLACGLVLATSGCSASPVTSDRLDHALGPAFSRLFAVHERQLGIDPARRATDFARCTRADRTHPRDGAGDDWRCTVDYPYPDGHVQPIVYDVQVAPTGCYVADGPAQVVGPQRQRDTQGAAVTNPLFEFDGCFDTT